MENHSVGHFFFSDRRLDIIRYLQKVRRRFSWERRSSQASSQAAPGMPEESGKETYSLQTLRNYTTWTRQKYTLKDSKQKKCFCRNRETHFTFLCANGSTKLAGKDHEVRTSDQSWRHSEPGEGHCGAHQGEADDPPQQNSKKHR